MSPAIVKDEEIKFEEKKDEASPAPLETVSTLPVNGLNAYILGVIPIDERLGIDHSLLVPYITLDRDLNFTGRMNIPKRAYLDLLKKDSPDLVELLECTDIGDILPDPVDVETVYNSHLSDLHIEEEPFSDLKSKKERITLLLRDRTIIPSYHFLGYCMENRKTFHAYYAHLAEKGKIDTDNPLIDIGQFITVEKPSPVFYEKENILSFVKESGQREVREMLAELNRLEKDLRVRVNQISLSSDDRQKEQLKCEFRQNLYGLLGQYKYK